MTDLLSASFLVAGSAICLLAAVGVLRLPDFFMRMHAATKAGVAGCGLVLISIGFAFPSAAMWAKIAIAVAFLLLTTPIAGHLLGRAGYVAGVQLWRGTTSDELRGELQRGNFDRLAGIPTTGSARAAPQAPNASRPITRIVLGLANGPDRHAAISQAIALAKAHEAELLTLAIIDMAVMNASPVRNSVSTNPSQLRSGPIEMARRSLADALESFEQAAASAGVAFRVRMEEGDPARILAGYQGPGSLVLIGLNGWFDHGASGGSVDPISQLVHRGNRPLILASGSPAQVRRINFLHDGSARSDATWEWLIALDPWPQAALNLIPDFSADDERLDRARQVARGMKRYFEDDQKNLQGVIAESQVVVFGNGGHAKWFRKSDARHRLHDAPITVFG